MNRTNNWLGLCVALEALAACASGNDATGASAVATATASAGGAAETSSASDGGAGGVGGSVDGGAGGMGGAGGVSCNPPLTACGDDCVDTESNLAHCGACGVSCGANNSCVAGECVAPPPCWALDFSQPADIVAAPAGDDLDYGDAYTVEAWALWRGQSDIEWQYLVMQGWEANDGDFVFRVQIKNSTVYFTTYDQYGPSGQVSQTTTLTGLENSWIHVAGVVEAGKAKLFLNGKLVATGNASKPSSTSKTAAVHIGGYDGGYPFDGIIDEVRISKGARYSADFAPPMFHAVDLDALALWRFDEGMGLTTVDATGHGHDGVISGAVWSPASACQNGGAP